MNRWFCVLVLLTAISTLLFTADPAIALEEQRCHDELHLAISTDTPSSSNPGESLTDSSSSSSSDLGITFSPSSRPLFKLGSLPTMVELSNGTIVAYFVDFSHGTDSPKLSCLSSSDSGVCWILADVAIVAGGGSALTVNVTDINSLDAVVATSTSMRLYFTISSMPNTVYSATTDSSSGHLSFTVEVGARYTVSTNLTTAGTAIVSTHVVAAAAGIAGGNSGAVTMLVGLGNSSANPMTHQMVQVTSTDGGVSFPVVEDYVSAWNYPGFGVMTNPAGNTNAVRIFTPSVTTSTIMQDDGKLNAYSTTVNTSVAAAVAGFPTGFMMSQFAGALETSALSYPTSTPQTEGARLSRASFVHLTNGSYLGLVSYSVKVGRSSTEQPCSTSIKYTTAPQSTVYGQQCPAANLDPSNAHVNVSPGEKTFSSTSFQIAIIVITGVLTAAVLAIVTVVLRKQCAMKATDILAARGHCSDSSTVPSSTEPPAASSPEPGSGKESVATTPHRGGGMVATPGDPSKSPPPAIDQKKWNNSISQHLEGEAEYQGDHPRGSTVTYDAVELLDVEEDGSLTSSNRLQNSSNNNASTKKFNNNNVPYHASSSGRGARDEGGATLSRNSSGLQSKAGQRSGCDTNSQDESTTTSNSSHQHQGGQPPFSSTQRLSEGATAGNKSPRSREAW